MIGRRIRLLDETTINQIAAGEVIENPASALKELMENAIDAGSTDIQVWTKGGGYHLIKVSDNGCGMNQDDLILALERHATSKLQRLEELESLTSLGFRGEALPSIASVSKMKLHSADQEGMGNVIEIEGGEIKSLKPLARRQGTTIEINSLFYNTPVRKKFQKNEGVSAGDLHKMLIKFVLCYPKVRITWFHDDELRFSFFSSFEERIKSLLSEEFSQNSLIVDHSSQTMKLWGYLSSPALHRPNRIGQYLFVNQRSIHSAWFSQKILEGYSTRLAQNRFPLFVLHLTLPPSWIDVNVHPQKREIRFREENQVSSFIQEGVARALCDPARFSYSFSDNPPTLTPAFCTSEGKSYEQSGQEYTLTLNEPTLTSQSYHQSDENTRLPIKQTYSVIAHVKHFFFIQELGGIRLINLSRALERIVYDELNLKKEKQSIQTLLLPLQMAFGGKEKEMLNRSLEALNESGIAIRHFGGETFLIDAIPSILEIDEISDLIYAFIETGTIPKKIGKYLKRKIPSYEMATLTIERLFTCPISDFTPDGKRIHKLLDERTMEKWID